MLGYCGMASEVLRESTIPILYFNPNAENTHMVETHNSVGLELHCLGLELSGIVWS